MLKNIYHELVKIREKLQAIRRGLEPETISFLIKEGNTNNLVIKDVQEVESISGTT